MTDATNLMIYSLQVLLLICAAGAAERLLPLHIAAARLVYWRAIIVCCLALPLSLVSSSPATGAGITVFAMIGAPSEAVARAWTTGVLDLFAIVAVTGACGWGFWLAAGLWRLCHLQDSSPLIDSHRVIERLRDSIAPRVELRCHASITQPVAFGWWRPTVLFPPQFSALTPEAQRAVACHELLHHARGDWLWLVGEELVRTVFWFHPAVRWALGQIELSREQEVDSAVVQHTAARGAYMRALLAYAEQRPLAAHALAFGRRRHLASRLRYLSAAKMSSRRRLVNTAIALACITGASLWTTASLLPLRAPEKLVVLPFSTTRHVKPVRLSAGMTPPRVLRKVDPVHSPAAIRARAQGDVVVDVVVATDGSVASTRVMQSIPLLDDAARDAAGQWRFTPTWRDGVPVEVLVSLKFVFSLR